MPRREFSRAQVFLLPPALDDFLPMDHPARFVGELVEGLDWEELGIDVAPAVEGRPSYPPELLLGCWLYGFMVRTRSCRQLERACTENVAFMWLTGFQRPDHNTLWRFYQAHRDSMRALFRQTVRVAVNVGLVDFALHAIDGTKIAASGAQRRTLNRKQLADLLERVEKSIAALEAENVEAERSGEATWRLPEELTDLQRLRERVRAGLEELAADPARATVNLTDPDARLMKDAHGYLTGYNAQAVVDGRAGILVGLEVTTGGADTPQLLSMVEEAEQTAGRLPDELVADGGYYSGPNVAAVEQLGVTFFAPVQPPSNQHQDPGWPFHASHFQYDEETDRFICPVGQPVTFSHTTLQRGNRVRIYRGRQCAHCPVHGQCTTDPKGRTLALTAWHATVAAHRQRMATAQAKERLRRRSCLIEPVFGVFKEQLGLRRFLLRGLRNVQAEWLLAGAAYNLRKLYRAWWQRRKLVSAVA